MIVTDAAPDTRPVYTAEATLCCPGCEREYPEWQYKRLKRNPRYRTVDVVKCPSCGHLFAPVKG